MNIEQEMIDEMHQHWKEQYKIVNDMPHEKRQLAITVLRVIFTQQDKDYFYATMLFYKQNWLHQIETGFHLNGGMEIRNELREAGLGEDYFGVGLDYIYAGLIEEAILGDGIRVTKDEVRD